MKKIKKLKEWQKDAIFGGIVGLIISFFIFSVFRQGYRFKWFIQPIFDLNTLITGCYKECYYMYFIYTLIFILIGVLIGFLINKLKQLRKK